MQSAAAMLSPLAMFRTDRVYLARRADDGLRAAAAADRGGGCHRRREGGAAARGLLTKSTRSRSRSFGDLEISLSAKVVLGLSTPAWIPARTQMTYLRRLKATVARVMGGKLSPQLKESPQRSSREGLAGRCRRGLVCFLAERIHAYALTPSTYAK